LPAERPPLRCQPASTLEFSSVHFRFSRLDEPERFIGIVIESLRSRRWRQLALFEFRDPPRSVC
jgi:hypothetical protein